MRSSLVMKEAYCQVARVEVNSYAAARARLTAMKTLFKRLLGLGALAAMGYAMWRAYERRKVNTGVNWDPQPFPYPPQPHTEAPSETPTPHRPSSRRPAKRPARAAGSSRTTARVPRRTR